MGTKASDFEVEVISRGEELKAFVMVKKAVVENTAGGTDQQYGFLQIASRDDLGKTKTAHFVKNLAKKQNALALPSSLPASPLP